MFKSSHGMRVLALTASAAVMLSACASTNSNMKAIAARPLPPLEASAEAATYVWQPSKAIGWRIHNGFDKRGILRPDTPPTYFEASALAQIEGRCATDIRNKLKGTGMIQLKEAVKSTTAQGLGSLAGVFFGFSNPSQDLIQQVTGMTTGTAAGGALYGADLQLRIIIDSAYASCVIETVKKENSLARVVPFAIPMGEYEAPKPLAPGVAEPTPDEMDEQSTSSGN